MKHGIMIRVDVDTFQEIQDMAETQGLPVSVMARAWVIQRLRKEAETAVKDMGRNALHALA